VHRDFKGGQAKKKRSLTLHPGGNTAVGQGQGGRVDSKFHKFRIILKDFYQVLQYFSTNLQCKMNIYLTGKYSIRFSLKCLKVERIVCNSIFQQIFVNIPLKFANVKRCT
jgi:hypothetical protein